MKFREKKRYMLIYFLCLSQISRGFKVLHKIQGYFQGSRSQNKLQAFQGVMRTLGGKSYLGSSTKDIILVEKGTPNTARLFGY